MAECTIFQNPELFEFVKALKRWKARIGNLKRREELDVTIGLLLSDSEEMEREYNYFSVVARLNRSGVVEYIDSQDREESIRVS